MKQIVSGIAPVASLVNWVGGEETTVYGGWLFVLSNRTDITSLKQLANASVCIQTCPADVRVWYLMRPVKNVLLPKSEAGC